MKLTADTNILVRASVKDDAVQSPLARKLLAEAERVAIPVAVFCEFAWVLRTVYRYDGKQIARSIKGYLAAEAVVTDIAAVEAGVSFLELGGDFSDGAIAYQGRKAGGAVFASFDRGAVRLLERLGHVAFCP